MKNFVYTLLIGLAVIFSNTSSAADTQPRVLLNTSHGDIVVELNPKAAPDTVKNFIKYVEDGFYDGTIFHRVIKDFMIQGGGFTTDYSQKTTRPPVKNEANNGLKNVRGSVAMARTNDPHSATAQFFINTVDNDFLNYASASTRGWGYAVFGRVVEGMDTVDKIRNVKTGKGGPFWKDAPLTPVIINKASIVKQDK